MRVKWVNSRELGHVEGVPIRGVVYGENGIDHRFLRGQITTLLEDSRTVCEGVPDRNVEFRDDQFKKCPCGIRHR